MKLTKYFLLFFALSFATVLWGQEVDAPAPKTDDALSNAMTWALCIFGAILFIVGNSYMISVNQMLSRKVMNMEAAANGVNLGNAGGAGVQQADSIWTVLRKKLLVDSVPVERESEIDLHHNYDGIRELDNRLPPWWVNMFLITIVWSVGYMWYYHFGGGGPLQEQEYNNSVENAKVAIAASLSKQANLVDESNVELLTDASALSEGQTIFNTSCAACHGMKGEGTVGPNLTDEYWIHGGGVKNVFKTIKYGVPEKGMIAWQAQLKPASMQKVASYIISLKGTNPPNPKERQGEIWKEEAAPAATPGDTKATKAEK